MRFRRTMIVAVAASILWGFAGMTAAEQAADQPDVDLSLFDETPEQYQERMQWWRDAKFGLFLHWGPVSLTGKELSWSRKGPRPGDVGGMQEIPAEEYDVLYKRFNPMKFDAKQWVQMAKDAGMKYIVFTAKHHDGFSNFHTKYSDHNIANSPFKRDIVKELADACHAAGLKFGVYYSTRDWYHPDYLVGDNRKYDEFYRNQVRELLSNYGKIDIMWFDHVGGQWKDWRFSELFTTIKRLQPDIVINNRGAAFVFRPSDQPTPEIAKVVRGDFDTPEEQLGRFNNQRAWESCMTLAGHQWSYKPGGEIYPLDQCIRMLVSCSVGDGNLLLNVGPRPDGLIEPAQADRLREMGKWLDKYGQSIYGTRGGPFRSGKWGGSTYCGNTVYLHIFQWENDQVKLPALPAKITSHRCLTGGTADVEQSDDGIMITMPADQRDSTDTILKLELDKPASEIEAR